MAIFSVQEVEIVYHDHQCKHKQKGSSKSKGGLNHIKSSPWLEDQ